MEAYLTEARILARLDHPHIVPVFDVGRTEDGLCFVVSKLVEGSDLAVKNAEQRLSFRDSAELVATIAEALHYAHTKGLVHRDVKPANILIDVSGKPSVADFGLALKDEDFGKGAGYAGTPAYMSPEQTKGEGHRVDGRSDIFSLGAMLYELLTGRRPFRGDSHLEAMEQIITIEPRPPRQINDSIPKELEHICQKALSKSLSGRYTTAKDMAEDLRQYQQAREDRDIRPVTLASHNLIHASEPVDDTKSSGRIRRLEIKSILGRNGCLIQITMMCSVLFGLMILSHEMLTTFEQKERVVSQVNRPDDVNQSDYPHIEIIPHEHLLDNGKVLVAMLLIILPCILAVHRLWQRLQSVFQT